MNTIFVSLLKHRYTIFLVVVFAIAVLLRVLWLENYPIGFHFDEAWYGYNAFLLLKRGMNIYGQLWPIDLDIFGDFVPAMHAYLSIPFVALFGITAFSVRIVTVLASLGCFVLGIRLLRMCTKHALVMYIFAMLFALSPWNIMMARASSTVILDTFVLLLFCVVYLGTLRKISQNTHNTRVWIGLVAAYAIAVLAYFTYFTSRILIVPFGLMLLMYEGVGGKFSRKLIVLGALPLLIYIVFPFMFMIRTPFALGRYQQVTLIENGAVRSRSFIDIAESGQAGLPVWMTRMLYNKITENVGLFLQHYAVFFSPNPMLFQTNPPQRYYLARVGAITLVEYVGWMLALGTLCLVRQKKHEKITIILFVIFLGLSAIPSALTLDDFPNFQRAVMMTPFVQIVAALGFAAWWKQMRWKKYTRYFIAVLMMCTIPSVVMFVVAYRVHQQWERPFYRNTSTIDVSVWINTHAHDDVLLIDHRDGTFLYPYLLAHEIILDKDLEKTEKNFITTQYMRIGKRIFVQNLCESPDMITRDYDKAILFIGEGCKIPWWMTTVYIAPFSNGAPGFAVLEPDRDKQRTLRNEYFGISNEAERKMYLLQALSEQRK